MTQEDKAKAYDKALERARKLYNGGETSAAVEIACENIFPELKESEDEKVIKWIIDDIRYNMNNEPLNNSEYKKKAEKAIAWLEKQGEQNPKVEPKFKAGDWVVDNYGCVWRIEGILNQFYMLECPEGGESRPTIDWVDNTFHLWTINDAKDGDVLADKYNNIGVFQERKGMYWHSYIYLGCDGELRGFNIGGRHEQTDTNPATKEQYYNLLFQEMKEAGYEWNADKKELKKEE